MHHRIRLLVDRTNPYVQFLIVLLLLALSFFAWMSLMGCEGCDKNPYTRYYSSPLSKQSTAPAPTFRGKIMASGPSAVGGQRVSRTIFGSKESGTAPTTVKYTWMPPVGASSVSFDEDFAPDNPGGPPPYVWSDADPNVHLNVEFNMPEVPTGKSSIDATETLTTEYAGSNASREQFTTTVRRYNAAEAAPATEAEAPTESLAGLETMAATIEVWETDKWYDPQDVALTTGLCQTWVDFLSGDEVFMAVQIPVTSRGPITESHSLSLVMGEYNPGTVAIQKWGQSGYAYEAGLETRDERASFMNTELPREEGKTWVALGLAEDAPACAAGMSAPANNWSIRAGIALDLRTLPDGGEGSYITSYMCYEGQRAPLAEAAVSAVAKRAGVGVAYSGEGITCLGPQILQFMDEPVWQLNEMGFTTITTTQTIQFHHYIEKHGGPALTLDYAIESTSDVEWGLYRGSASAPNLSQPVSGALVISQQYTDIWLVSDALGEETPAGSHSVQLTLTNAAAPTDVQSASDLFWVGDWVAPPLPGGYVANPFLPLIVR